MSSNLAQYTERGIERDPMACIAIMPKREAKDFVWILATNGIEAQAARDPDGKRWHVAVRGAFAYNPASYFASIRGEEVRTCTSTLDGQHPLAIEKEDE